MTFKRQIVDPLGNMIVKAMQSINYSPGVAGWKLDQDGNAEFSNMILRGDLTITTLDSTLTDLSLRDSFNSRFWQMLGIQENPKDVNQTVGLNITPVPATGMSWGPLALFGSKVTLSQTDSLWLHVDTVCDITCTVVGASFVSRLLLTETRSGYTELLSPQGVSTNMAVNDRTMICQSYNVYLPGSLSLLGHGISGGFENDSWQIDCVVNTSNAAGGSYLLRAGHSQLVAFPLGSDYGGI